MKYAINNEVSAARVHMRATHTRFAALVSQNPGTRRPSLPRTPGFSSRCRM